MLVSSNETYQSQCSVQCKFKVMSLIALIYLYKVKTDDLFRNMVMLLLKFEVNVCVVVQ